MSMTEPQMRADVVAQVQAMAEPVEQAAPVAAETPVEAVEDGAEVGDEATSDATADVVNGDTPDSQDQGADGAEGSTEGEEGEDQAAQAVDAPQFWSKEAKDNFATLPPETQQFLVEQDKAAQKAISAKFEEAAAARKAAETQAEALSGLAGKLTEAATLAEETFGNKWRGMTNEVWLQLSRADPAQYTELRAQYDYEQNALQQANAAKEAAARVERQNWLKAQAEELKTYAPELTDPVKGKEKFQKTLEYLKSRGAKEQDLGDVSAAVMALAYDSMQLHELRKNAPKPTPKPTPKPGLVPAASVAAAPPKQRELQVLENRFAQTKDRGDAVALLMKKGIL